MLGQTGTRHVDRAEAVLMQPQEATPRKAGRVLVIDPAGRVLLLQGFDPAKPGSLHWITIGGGLDHGEGTVTSYRWWSREELAVTTEAFFPAELPELLRLAEP